MPGIIKMKNADIPEMINAPINNPNEKSRLSINISIAFFKQVTKFRFDLASKGKK